jgi:head-tail adaptor
VLLHDTVERLRPAPVGDGYGNNRPDWTSPATVTLPAEVQPMSGDEDLADQNRTTTRWRLFLNAGADIVATDRIRWDGRLFEVDGDVERWKRRGVEHHIEAVLTRVVQL